MRTTVLGGLAAGAFLLAACGTPTPEAPGTPSVGARATPASSAVRDQAFPTDTLQDWVTYGDRVVAIEIVAEARDAPTPGAGKPSRRRTVRWEPRHVLWANPARPQEDVPASGTASGGDYTSGRERAGVEPYGGDPVLFVGHTYLAVLAHTGLGAGADVEREWIPMAVLPFDDDLVGDGERFGGWEGEEATLDALWGKDGQQVAALLAATPVDPYARPYAARDATEKWQLTARKKLR